MTFDEWWDERHPYVATYKEDDLRYETAKDAWLAAFAAATVAERERCLAHVNMARQPLRDQRDALLKMIREGVE